MQHVLNTLRLLHLGFYIWLTFACNVMLQSINCHPQRVQHTSLCATRLFDTVNITPALTPV